MGSFRSSCLALSAALPGRRTKPHCLHRPLQECKFLCPSFVTRTLFCVTSDPLLPPTSPLFFATHMQPVPVTMPDPTQQFASCLCLPFRQLYHAPHVRFGLQHSRCDSICATSV